MLKLLRDLSANVRKILRLSIKHAEIYVNFDYEIELCLKHNLFLLTNQLVELKRTIIERAVASILENSMNKSHAISVSSRSIDEYDNQSLIIARQSDSKESYTSKDSIVSSDTERSNTEDSKKDDDSFEKNDDSSVDIDDTQLYASRSDIFDDEISLSQSNDDSEVDQT